MRRASRPLQTFFQISIRGIQNALPDASQQAAFVDAYNRLYTIRTTSWNHKSLAVFALISKHASWLRGGRFQRSGDRVMGCNTDRGSVHGPTWSTKSRTATDYPKTEHPTQTHAALSTPRRRRPGQPLHPKTPVPLRPLLSPSLSPPVARAHAPMSALRAGARGHSRGAGALCPS